jgi:hypothetical protein
MKARILFVSQLVALVFALNLVSTSAEAQTVISNETLVTTTFVVNQTQAIAKCNTFGCTANAPMLSSIPVTCPAAIGKTCTFHIQLTAKVEATFPCRSADCIATGPKTSFQFQVDDAVPSPGPVEGDGYYLFGQNVAAVSQQTGELYFARQSYPASIVATVTNTSSTSHTINVNVACTDTSQFGGCNATAHFSTMRVDVFEP